MSVTFKNPFGIHANVLARAIKTSMNSDVNRGKIGAVVSTDSNQILAFACNQIFVKNTHGELRTIHAERFLLAKIYRMRLIERYGRSHLRIIIVRYKFHSNTLSNAKPCERCFDLLKPAGIPTYYTDYDGELTKLEL